MDRVRTKRASEQDEVSRIVEVLTLVGIKHLRRSPQGIAGASTIAARRCQ
jgi:hypothetical protein